MSSLYLKINLNCEKQIIFLMFQIKKRNIAITLLHSLYYEKYYMKKFYESLVELAKNTIDFQKKNLLPLTKKS